MHVVVLKVELGKWLLQPLGWLAATNLLYMVCATSLTVSYLVVSTEHGVCSSHLQSPGAVAELQEDCWDLKFAWRGALSCPIILIKHTR